MAMACDNCKIIKDNGLECPKCGGTMREATAEEVAGAEEVVDVKKSDSVDFEKLMTYTMRMAPLVLAVAASMVVAFHKQLGIDIGGRKLTNEGFASDGVVMVYFYATWCGYCQESSPIIEEVRNDYLGRAVVAMVDVDESPEVADKFGVHGVPTVIIFSDREEVQEVPGGAPKEYYEAMLNRYIKKEKKKAVADLLPASIGPRRRR